MRPLVLACLAAAAFSIPSVASAKVHITVDLDTQRIHVESKDHVYDWKVSSGAPGYDTPAGTYGVLWTDKTHTSDEYDGAPMPNAIFFKPGFAIHGAYKSNWGHPASHGCVRLPVANSAVLFDLVKAEGAEIKIVGGSGPSAPLVASARPRRVTPAAAVDADGYESSSAVLANDAAVLAPPPRSFTDRLFGTVY